MHWQTSSSHLTSIKKIVGELLQGLALKRRCDNQRICFPVSDFLKSVHSPSSNAAYPSLFSFIFISHPSGIIHIIPYLSSNLFLLPVKHFC
ncbi:hypothetical protein EYC84_011422 [Monilinia fructicola]|uniref:Uncharacterized protein n=1 Tax=Monilinia fructicola TaxID=38448 RepID=A0A5M9J897_MONFR|nr:hypothetical protein EYC84_011422 [Monilinia fructicola]